MLINEVAKKTGQSIHTLRFYEKEGLIQVKRNSSNYRIYDEYTVDKLICIGQLRKLGFSIADLKNIEKHKDNKENVKQQKIRLLEKYSKEFETQKQQLENDMEVINNRLSVLTKD